MQRSSPTLQSPSPSPARPVQIRMIPEQGSKTHYIQKKAARWPTLFPLQWSGHNQSGYVNENIKKENWDYLFVLPSKYKGKRSDKGTRFAPSVGPPLQMFRISVHPWVCPKLDFQQTKVQRMPRGPILLCINADRCSLTLPSASYNFVAFNTLLGPHRQAGVLWWL